MRLYLSKFNPKCEALFQLPRRDWTEANGAVQTVWYENCPLGVNTLGSVMKEISENQCCSPSTQIMCSGNSDNLVVISRLGRSAHLPHFGPQKPEQSPIPGHRHCSAEKVQWCSVIRSNRIHSDHTDAADVLPTIPVCFFSTTRRNVIRSCRITPINILQQRGDSQ